MATRTKLVIIGSGIVGASIAYHLAQMGWNDIIILDKGQLPHNDGSTSHAPGGVVVSSHNKTMARFAQYSAQLYKQLPQYGDTHLVCKAVGGLELARTEARWEDFKRLHSACKSFGIESELISPQEVQAHYHHLYNPEAYIGALWVPESCQVRGAGIIGSMLGEAQRMAPGIEVVPHTLVTDIELVDGRVAAVLTNNPAMPRIDCEIALLATNIWSSQLSDKLGVSTPLMAYEHQYVTTEPLDELRHLDPADLNDEMIFPLTRDVDHTLYYRNHWQNMGVGSYWHRPHPVSPHDLTAEQNAMHTYTPEDMVEAWELAAEMLPAIRGKALATKFNGMFAFSVDGMPIMGPTHVPGFWTCVASWITHAAGVGKSLAEWMANGSTEWDMRQCNVNRFNPHMQTNSYIKEVTFRMYEQVYDIFHPSQTWEAPRNIRHTPFYTRHAEMKADFAPFAGMELPRHYAENSRLLEKYEAQIPKRDGWGAMYWSPIQGAEHLEVRNNAGMFDLSGLSIIEVSGGAAVTYTNQLCTNQMDVPVGEVVYTCWLDQKGGIKRDLTVARVAADTFWLFVGEGTIEQDLFWVRQHAPAAVTVRDISQQYAAIGVWGPNARKIVQKAAHNDMSNAAFPYYTWQWIEIGMAKVFAMRISYAGELGWEFHVPMESAVHVWDALWEAGREDEMILAGMGCFGSLRLEKGYRLWGADIHTEYNLYEAGMRWTAKVKKPGGFIGRDAMLAAKQAGIKKTLCCLTLDAPDAVLFGYEPIFAAANGQAIGHVTTADYGYSMGKYIAYAYLPNAYATPGTEVEVEYFNKRYAAVVAAEPLYDPKMARMKA